MKQPNSCYGTLLLRWPRLAVSIMHLSGVCPSVPFSFLTLIGHAAYTQLNSPGGSTQHGQWTFTSKY